jgi:CRISPR-associated protein Csb2
MSAAFSIFRPDASGYRPFDPARQGLTVAGMVRHATKIAAELAGKPGDWIDSFVLGHGEGREADGHTAVGPRRFAYLPIPTLETRGGDGRRVGSIRRVLVTTFAPDCGTEIVWARRALTGMDLVREPDQQAVAMLSVKVGADWVLDQYTNPAVEWATVTPVVLPGYDDPAHLRRRLDGLKDAEEQKRLLARLETRIDGLLRKAIVQAGLPRTLADHAEIAWRKVGFLAGVDLADRYGVPDHLKRFPRYHVRIGWRDASGNGLPIPGPICLGGGRFLGLGLFVAAPS